MLGAFCEASCGFAKRSRRDQATGTSNARSDTVAASTAFAIEAATGLKARSYLRAAQAYMLISMPTGTSTIFGAFQAIRGLPSIERDIAPGKT